MIYECGQQGTTNHTVGDACLLTQLLDESEGDAVSWLETTVTGISEIKYKFCVFSLLQYQLASFIGLTLLVRSSGLQKPSQNDI